MAILQSYSDKLVGLMNVNSPYIFVSSINNEGSTITNLVSDDLGRPSTFMSLTNKRSTDEATTMDLQLAYAPSSANAASNDADLIEKIITQDRGDCLVGYGWKAGSVAHRYAARMTDYQVEFNNGVLTYRISLISKAVNYNYSMIDFNIDSTDSPETVLSKLNDLVDKYAGDYYEFDVEASSKNFTVPDNGIQLIGSKSVVAAIKSVARGLIPENSASLFNVIVDDRWRSDNKPRIYIKESNPNKIEVEYAVNWNSPSDGVLNWSSGFRGNIAIGLNSNKSLSDWGIDTSRCYVDLRNGSASIADLNNNYTTAIKNNAASISNALLIPDGTKRAQSFNTVKSWWNRNADYPYTGTLEVLGSDSESLELGDFIQVNVVFSKSVHHTSGVYMILDISDSISSSGFTTTYQLVRYTDNIEDPTPSPILRGSGGVGSGGGSYVQMTK